MERKYKIKILDAKKDSDLLFRIVEHENEVFGEATVGNRLANMEKFLRCLVMMRMRN